MKTAVLTVIYAKNDTIKTMVKQSLGSVPSMYHLLAVVNSNDINVPLEQLCDEVLKNDENCLAKAWNLGLHHLFDNGYDNVLIINQDVLIKTAMIERMEEYIEEYGIVSARPVAKVMDYVTEYTNREVRNIKHGDQSFSCFMISKEAFEHIGDFDEEFKPAYFEDNDYLERAWKLHYNPQQLLHTVCYHNPQTTVKTDRELAEAYPTFMQKNLERFKEKWGKVPDHLPSNISFKK